MVRLRRLTTITLILLFVAIVLPASAVTLSELDQLYAGNVDPRAEFGYSVAVDGTMVVVGAYKEDAGGINNAGAAYVFDCSSLPCTQVSKLTAGDAGEDQIFGTSVAISGNLAFVGGKASNDEPAVYVFDLTTCGSSCTHDQRLRANNTTPGNDFGSRVAASGSILVVGSSLADGGATRSGAVYAFDCSSLPCTQTSRMTASDAADYDLLGTVVAIDGMTVIAGAHNKDADESERYEGAAYVFDLATCGATCTEVSKLTPSDATWYDAFGAAVAVHGTTAVVGARREIANDTGRAYAFDLATCGAACNEVNILTASDMKEFARFGEAVAVHGTTAVIGAWSNDYIGDSSGTLYRFDLDTCGAACNESQLQVASDTIQGDDLGRSVAMTDAMLVAGAPGRNEGGDADVGTAYLFALADAPDISATLVEDFGEVYADGPPLTQAITITNQGQQDLTLGALSTSGADAERFAVTSGPGLTTLSPGGSTTVDVTFDPATVGDITGLLQIASNDPDENPFAVTLEGVGTAPRNPSFEDGTNSPAFWKLVERGAADARWSCNAGSVWTGDCAINLEGPGDEFAAVYSGVLNEGGGAGETFTLQGNVYRRYNTDSVVAFGVIVHRTDGTKKKWWVPVPNLQKWHWIQMTFTTLKPYDYMVIGVLMRPHGSYARVDDITLLSGLP